MNKIFKTRITRTMRAAALFLATACLLAASESVKAQQSSADEYATVKGDGNAGELNSARLDLLTSEHLSTNERIFIIARLGRGETAHLLNLQRLNAARSYLLETKRLNQAHLIFAEGEKIAGEGRIEFYLGGRLKLVSLAERGQNIRFNCCDGETKSRKKKEVK